MIYEQLKKRVNDKFVKMGNISDDEKAEVIVSAAKALTYNEIMACLFIFDNTDETYNTEDRINDRRRFLEDMLWGDLV